MKTKTRIKKDEDDPREVYKIEKFKEVCEKCGVPLVDHKTAMDITTFVSSEKGTMELCPPCAKDHRYKPKKRQ